MERIETQKEQTPDFQGKQGRKGYRRNLVDLLIIVIIILSVISLFFRGRIVGLLNNAMSNDRAEIEFVICDVDSETADKFDADAEYYIDGISIGSLALFEIRDSEKMIVQSTVYEDSTRFDEFIRAADSEHKVIRAGATLVGISRESGFYFCGTTKIAVGMTMEISAKEQKYTILITGISGI